MLEFPPMKTSFARIVLLTIVVGPLAACTSARVVRDYYPDKGAPAAAGAPPRAPATRPVVLPIPASETYVVKAGDTLYGIATRYGLNYHQVAEWNGLAEPYAIQVGQPLVLAEPPEITTEPDVAPAPVASTPKPPAASPPAVTKPSAPTPFEAVPATPVATAPAPSTPVATAPPATKPAPPVTAPSVTAPPVPIPVPTPAPSVPVVAPVVPVVSAPIEKPAPPIAGAPSWRWPTRGDIIGRYVSGDQTQQGINIAGKAGQTVNAAADGVVVYSGAGLVGYGELIIIKHSDEWLSAYAHNRRRLVAEGTKLKAGDAIAEMGRTGAVRDMLHFEIRRNGKPVDPLLYLPKQ